MEFVHVIVVFKHCVESVILKQNICFLNLLIVKNKICTKQLQAV
jgi:hypothetical protein